MKPMKRVMMILMAFTLFFAVTVPDFADARRGGASNPEAGALRQLRRNRPLIM